MLVDLVQTVTRDGVRLDGAYQAPASPAAPFVPFDAVCFFHGTGGNFYNSSLFDVLSEYFLAHGCGVLRVNTRGHDGISTAVTSQGGKRQGAAYEVVDDCRHDVAGWIDWLARRAGPRLGVVGHSFGAIKALYALGREPHPAVAGLVALSPPFLSYSRFCDCPTNADFLETFARAEKTIASGQPAALLEVSFPMPYVVSAAGFVEKYGPDELCNFLKSLPGIPCPTLVTFGSIEVENHSAFRGAPEAVRELCARIQHLAVEVVAGADHFYSGTRKEVLERVDGWLRNTLRTHPSKLSAKTAPEPK